MCTFCCKLIGQFRFSKSYKWTYHLGHFWNNTPLSYLLISHYRKAKTLEVLPEDTNKLLMKQSSFGDYEDYYETLSCEYDCVLQHCDLGDSNCEEKCKDFCQDL